jgi:hypothetical protein
VVEPGSRLAVAVFDNATIPGNDDIDLRGATANQVDCGAGFDTVQAQPPFRIWGDCEQVNGVTWMPTTVVGSMQGGELDAAPGGIAWIDDGLSLHVRTALSRPGHTLRASRSTQFKHLDVGLDPHGRTVATVAECRSGHPCAWLSVPVSTGRRSALPVTAPPDCRVVSVARWRTRTAMGVSCRTPRSTNVVVAQDGRLQRLANTTRRTSAATAWIPESFGRPAAISSVSQRSSKKALPARRSAKPTARRLAGVTASAS